jgi:glutamate synthase (NADPH/NADH) large chain
MSGGIAYVWDPDDTFHRRVNGEMIDLDPLDDEDREIVRGIVRRHQAQTGSAVASRLLDRWHESVRSFVKVFPRDYKRVLEAMALAEQEGRDVDEAVMAAAHG